METVAPVGQSVWSRNALAVELPVLLGLAFFFFFWGTSIGDFVRTEALRALVVKEMLQSNNLLVPTVHGRTYLRKPPLYAWTTYTLARLVGRLDEPVARWPSAAMGIIYVLAVYFAARSWLDVRAGPAAAIFAASNWMVLDDCNRAELDAGVLALSTVALVLLGSAWMSTRRSRWVLLACAYAAALAGSFWKAPHVLFTFWFTLVAIGFVDSRSAEKGWRRFCVRPVQFVFSGLCLAVLALWFVVLSDDVGADRAGRFVLIEFAARVFPLNLENLLGMLWGPPVFIFVTLPASLFASCWFFKSMWTGLTPRNRMVVKFLLAWLLPNLAFYMFVPAKSPRYWFPILAPVALLATMAWRAYRENALPGHCERLCRHGVRFILATGAFLGLAMVAGSPLLATKTIGIVDLTRDHALILAAAGVVAMASAALGWRWAGNRPGRLGVAFVLILLAIKPLHALVYVPARSDELSVRHSAEILDRAVPTGSAVFLVSDRRNNDRSGDLADFGYYCKTPLYWPDDLNAAMLDCGTKPCYLLVREGTREEMLGQFAGRASQIDEFSTPSGLVYLLRVDP